MYYKKDYYFVQLQSEEIKFQFVRNSLQTLYNEYNSNKPTALEYDELQLDALYSTKYTYEERLGRIRY